MARKNEPAAIGAYTLVLDDAPDDGQPRYRETPIAFGAGARPIGLSSLDERRVPERIRQMRRLHDYADDSYTQRHKNFFLQGIFMADYEDNAPWHGNLHRYFPVYDDLSVSQLRGYFTWRTQLRKGRFEEITPSFAYLYIYEILNGIGTKSVEEGIGRLVEFEKQYIDAGFGDDIMRRNLRQWRLEFAVVSGLPPDKLREYAHPQILKTDAALYTLKNPQSADDAAVFDAMCAMGNAKLATSPVVTKKGDAGIHLFAETWRVALAKCLIDGKNLFAACFGTRCSCHWYPLANAVYWRRYPMSPVVRELNPCHHFLIKDGGWFERCYRKINFNRELFAGFLHETDRQLRNYFRQVGGPMRERKEESWASEYVHSVIQADQKARIEAARPKVSISFTELDKIRDDALQTQDWLLTDDEKADAPCETPVAAVESPSGQADETSPRIALDDFHAAVVCALLRGESPAPLIAAHHAMPEIIADALNEAFFDEIGDTAFSCDDGSLAIIEDYRDDVARLIGEF